MPENQEALELWQQIKAFGANLVFKLLDLRLTKFEAEELLQKLSLIENLVNEIQAQQQSERN